MWGLAAIFVHTVGRKHLFFCDWEQFYAFSQRAAAVVVAVVDDDDVAAAAAVEVMC